MHKSKTYQYHIFVCVRRVKLKSLQLTADSYTYVYLLENSSHTANNTNPQKKIINPEKETNQNKIET